jgi:hypothetical protein
MVSKPEKSNLRQSKVGSQPRSANPQICRLWDIGFVPLGRPCLASQGSAQRTLAHGGRVASNELAATPCGPNWCDRVTSKVNQVTITNYRAKHHFINPSDDHKYTVRHQIRCQSWNPELTICVDTFDTPLSEWVARRRSHCPPGWP